MPSELDATFAAWGWPKFRGKQVREWAYSKLVIEPRGMTNLSKRDQQFLAEGVDFAAATIASRQSSSDGTEKLLLSWPAGLEGPPPLVPPGAGAARTAPAAETVMIPDGDRRTACVSSQVGCPVGCRFCASGMGGVKGNLTAAQIVEQVFQLNLLLRSAGDKTGHITNIVFMGMGEPLANYANVMQAVRVLHDPQCFNIGARRITISTVGVPRKIRDLANEDLPVNLAISLHAPTEPLRKQLIPWAEHFSLEDILDAARYYFDQTGREITLEYILLAGVNDQSDHARQLARLCKTLRANVNLIRYNSVSGLPYARPASQDVVNFQNILRNGGINAHVRKSRGRDIDAACGQLKRKQEEQKEQVVTVGVGGASAM